MPLGCRKLAYVAFKLANVEQLFQLKPPYGDPKEFSKLVLTLKNVVKGCYRRGE